MEIINYILTLALALALPVIALVLYALSNGNKNLKLPPGSYGWPLIGETLAFVNQSHGKFISERMQKYSPKIFKTKIFGEKAVVLCGTAGHKFIAANEGKLFHSWRPLAQQRLFRSYQKSNSAITSRKAELQVVKVPGFLRPESLLRYMQDVDTLVRQHVEEYWAGNDVVEVYRLNKLLVLTFSCRFFAGLEDEARVKRLAELMGTMMYALHIMAVNIPGTVFYKGMRAAKKARKDLQRFIGEKKEAMAGGSKMTDGLAFMITTPDENDQLMPENEISDKLMGLLTSTFNSPSLAISFIVKYLGEHPQICEGVRREQLEIASSKKDGEALNWEDIQKMKYSWNVALEVMRFVPPIQGGFREALTDFTYEGYTIPKGWKVYWTVSTINMDPEYLKRPEEFDPTRFEKSSLPPFCNIPFGSGPRICPGIEFARLQILSFIHRLVTSFKWEVLNSDCKVFPGMNPIPVDGLYVRLQSCNST